MSKSIREFQPLRRGTIALLVWGLLSVAGCGSDGPQGGPRVETFPITGTVTIDGQPVETLLVVCHPVEKGPVPTTISSFTDKEGKFSIGTYESGDGAPEGDYKLTFKWGQWNMGRYGGPDKLNDRYTAAEKSEVTVSVKKGVPIDLGTIALTTN
ncbi:MAG: hypothetical protein O2955_01725 [Planctomycetota bacterium]|nr:hypothetical protein [Planctomycetota bacterium]